MKRIFWCAIFLAASVLGSPAQTIKVPESWDKLAAKADEVVKVTLDKKMLQFASRFMDNEDDAEGKRIVSKLNGVYVRSLQFTKPGEFTDADVAPIRAQLQGPEWSRIVQVDSRSDSEHVEIFIHMVGNQNMGMVILSQEPKELVLVHLDGPINPEDLDDLSGNFGVPKSVHSPKKTATQPKPPTEVKK
jgi:hypothetical protein